MTDLKPCPFCGGEAFVIAIHADFYRAGCDKHIKTDSAPLGDFWDGCAWLDGFSSEAEAITAWNTRTPAPDVSGLLEALRAIIARWDTPAWKDAEPTGAVIDRGRAELAKWEGR